MATAATVSCFYTETPLSLDQEHSQSIIQISVPGRGSSFLGYNSSGQRRFISEIQPGEDDETFTRRHIGSDGSIFFRSEYPRALLWRLLDSRQILEIRSVDLLESRPAVSSGVRTKSAYSIRLKFPSKIVPFGVSFVDSKKANTVHIFVVTKAGTLHTFDFPLSFLQNAEDSAASVETWSHTFQPPSTSFKKPYRLVALSATQLVLSMHDGTLSLLTRPRYESLNDDWAETFLSHTSWKFSIKNLLPWNPNETITFEDLSLHSNCAVSIVPSPDGKFVFTVSLNHLLRVWRIEDGMLVHETDLIGNEPNSDSTKVGFFFEPSQRDVLRVVPNGDSETYVLASFSQHYRQFNFWLVRDPTFQAAKLEVMCPDFKFTPPIEDLMGVSVWSVEEFHIESAQGLRNLKLWMRIQSTPISKVFSVPLDLTSHSDKLEKSWFGKWSMVDPGTQTTDYLKRIAPTERNPRTVEMNRLSSEEWLEFLFYPGRFSVPTIECALAIYADIDSSRPDPLFSSKIPLKQRVLTAIRQHVSGIEKKMRIKINAVTRELEESAQWSQLFAFVRDLHQRRSDPLSFVYDSVDQLGWMVRADFVSPIRQCSQLESIRFNQYGLDSNELSSNTDDMFQGKNLSMPHAQILLVSAQLRHMLPPEFYSSLNRIIKAYVSQDISAVSIEMLSEFADECGLNSCLSKDIVEFLSGALFQIPELRTLGSQVFYDITYQMNEPTQSGDSNSPLTRYGATLLVQGSREISFQHREILVDLLVFLVLVATGLDTPVFSELLNAPAMFFELISLLREQSIVDWLLQKTRLVDDADSPPTMPPSPLEATSSSTTYTKHSAISVFEMIYRSDFQEISTPAILSSPEKITYWCQAWISGLGLSQEFNTAISNITRYLIAQGDYNLALEFLNLVPSNPWNLYLKARASVMVQKLSAAATFFKKAASHLSSPRFNVDLQVLDFSSREPTNPFGAGIHNYYAHVARYFEQNEAYAYALDFLTLALNACAPYVTAMDSQSTQLSSSHTLAGSQSFGHADPGPVPFQVTLQVQAFTNALRIGAFETAYSILVNMSSKQVQCQYLESFLITLASSNQISRLIEYPFTLLQRDVDTILESLCNRMFSEKEVSIGLSDTHVYHRALYSWRTARNDFRGAAAILHDLLTRLHFERKHTTSEMLREHGEELYKAQDKAIADCYLMLINSLACCGEDQQWIITGKAPDFDELAAQSQSQSQSQAGAGRDEGDAIFPDRRPVEEGEEKRKVLTLQDVRREYQFELDQVSAADNGHFSVGPDGYRFG